MSVKLKTKGIQSVINHVQKEAANMLGSLTMNVKRGVMVGYTAEYAIYVHENLEMKTRGQRVKRPSGIGVFWGRPGGSGGQAKFLEQPARLLKYEVISRVQQAVKRKKTIMEALLIGGQYLLRESQKLVPIEYGDLKNSGFVKEM